jgi:beta-lactamase class A
MFRTLLAAFLVLFGGFAEAQPPARRNPLATIEHASGGRLGVALIDAQGRVLISHRRDERFATCSTFKLLLAGLVFHGGGSMREPLRYTRADLLPNSPVTEAQVAAGSIPNGLAARAAVTQSDNTAANLLLRAMGGPAAFTRRLRAIGDRVTRLDRYELELNENVPGDPRDTTSPAAMAESAGRFVLGDLLHPSYRRQLRAWMTESRTGVRRIRAGLPGGWEAGDKTGSCGTAYNDVAFLLSPRGRDYMLAVYLDRPSVPSGRAEAAIADVGRLAVTRIAEVERAETGGRRER